MDNTYNTKCVGVDGVVDGVRLNSVLSDFNQMIQAILEGDIILSCDPATLGSSAAAVTTAIAGDGFTRDVDIYLKDTSGNPILYNGTLAIAVTETTAGDGTSAIVGGGSTVQMTNGVGSVSIQYVGTWAEADTQTLTVTGGTIAGKSVTNKTSVDTLVA